MYFNQVHSEPHFKNLMNQLLFCVGIVHINLHNFSFYLADMPPPTEAVKWMTTCLCIRGQNYGTRAQSQHLFDGDVPFFTGELAIDISNKVISKLIHSRPGASQYPPED